VIHLLICLYLIVSPTATLISAQGEIPWRGDVILFDLHISFESDRPVREISLSLPQGTVLGYMSFEGDPVSWMSEKDKLVISLPREVPADERFGLNMRYSLRLSTGKLIEIARWAPEFGYPVPITLSLKLPPWFRLRDVPKAKAIESGGMRIYTWRDRRATGFTLVKMEPPKPVPVMDLADRNYTPHLFRLIYRPKGKTWYAYIDRNCLVSKDGIRWEASSKENPIPPKAMERWVCDLGGGRSFHLVIRSHLMEGFLETPDGIGRRYEIDRIHPSEGEVAGLAFDPGSKRLHLVYLDRNGDLRHRSLFPPYRPNNWIPKLGGGSKGYPVAKSVDDFALSIDKSENPARLIVVYIRKGEVLRRDYDGVSWSDREFKLPLPSGEVEKISMNEESSERTALLYLVSSPMKRVMFLPLWR